MFRFIFGVIVLTFLLIAALWVALDAVTFWFFIGAVVLFFLLIALLIALDALRVSNRKKKVDLSTVDKNSGGFLVTHGMVMNEETGDIVPQSDYSETLYRSLSD